MSKISIGMLLILTLACGSAVQAYDQQSNESGQAFESFFSKKQQFDSEGTEIYSTNRQLKQHKRFGFGTAIGGVGGVLGIHGEFNLDPMNALVLSVGTGPSYGTLGALWKYNFESHYLSPYTKLGYSKWFSSGGTAGTARDSDILRRIFSEKDLRAGKFDADFLASAVGAEYNQLEGELSGVNFFGEVVLLTELKSSTIIPTGSVGMTYFY
jgi:hypothetical protein